MSLIQQILPQKLITIFLGKLASCTNKTLKNFLIKKFIKAFKVDLSEAEINNINDFKNFNDFFTRKLKPGAREFNQDKKTIISPADGFLGQYHDIKSGQLIQAKGKHYSVASFLACDQYAKEFNNGSFATVYLAPHNYHRVHMPLDGTLLEMKYIPGKLFSVNPKVCNDIDNVFSRNERVACVFQTSLGKVAIVLVGAIVVGGIETTWHGCVTPPYGSRISNWEYPNTNSNHVKLKKGDELGLFKVGSTVVMLFENKIKFDDTLNIEQTLTVGEKLAKYE